MFGARIVGEVKCFFEAGIAVYLELSLCFWFKNLGFVI